MREQQNPSTPELHQPLLFAPSELLACGLRGRASPSTRRRPHGGRRAVLAHVACDGVGASPGRVGTHGHQLLLDRSRLRFEGESRTRVCGRGGLRRSAEAHLLRRWPSVAELGTSGRSSRTISCPGRRSIKQTGSRVGRRAIECSGCARGSRSSVIWPRRVNSCGRTGVGVIIRDIDRWRWREPKRPRRCRT